MGRGVRLAFSCPAYISPRISRPSGAACQPECANVEFVADQLANLEQPVNLQGRFTPCQLCSVALHRHLAFALPGENTR